MTERSANVFATMLDRVHAALEALVAAGGLPAGLDHSRVLVEPPREAAHGDMATNAAMVLAKPAGRKPRDLAEAIAGPLRGHPAAAQAPGRGPGYSHLTHPSGR